MVIPLHWPFFSFWDALVLFAHVLYIKDFSVDSLDKHNWYNVMITNVNKKNWPQNSELWCLLRQLGVYASLNWWLLNFLKMCLFSISFMHICVCLYEFICTMCLQMPMEAKWGHKISWNCGYSLLWATRWVLGTKSSLSAWAVKALNYWAFCTSLTHFYA